MQKHGVAMIVHGGAWNIPDAEWKPHLDGVNKALMLGMESLHAGGHALDAVIRAITYLEEDPVFDAGVGSVLNEAGRVQMDAGLMCGTTLQVGAVAAVETCHSAIEAAHLVLQDDRAVFLVGEGADQFARSRGAAQRDPEALIISRERERFSHCEQLDQDALAEYLREDMVGDTVGAIALDAEGHIVAGNSTGGTTYKYVGRVGDSPLPGAGFLADNTLGGVCCTGWGEYIIRSTLASRVMGLMAVDVPAMSAAQSAVDVMVERLQGKAGVICLHRDGGIGAAHSTPRMAWAGIDAKGRRHGPSVTSEEE
ncbi:MAG TPA: peptidase T [Myxococcales bacterium]|nr:peptidase T [Deltaproteobacteria bacterium]HAA55999.1 peptidase T [Myxococcales bacterium]|tara:strand:- start:7951 stop:8880 length:930 start_codon:yes stop_codon:yes gene_type:complete